MHPNATRLTPCGFRDEGEQILVILDGSRLLVEALVRRRLVERVENGAEREMAFGIAPAASHRVIVEQQTGYFPTETPQDVSQCLAHQTMGAHHPG